jgi:hypothetical protein
MYSFCKNSISGIVIGLSFCLPKADAADGNLFFQKPIDTVEKRLKDSIIVHYKKYPQEKVFVHTNQREYCTGETIWYKTYTMCYGKPSALSKLIYLQLSDSAGNILVQNKRPLIDGKAYGNIDIGQNIKSGWYKLSAFTSWMMNFGPPSYHNQLVYIKNIRDPVATPNASIKRSYYIKFYPEGGDLVDGSLSNIAFKAYRDDGMPVSVSGIIKDNSKKIIGKLNTIHDGMGEFAIETYAENSYVATVNFPNGLTQNFPLPRAKKSGVYLRTSQNDDLIEIKLSFSGPAERFANCILVATQNIGTVITYPLQLANGLNSFEIKKSLFSTGVLRLTVFDNKGLPRAERLLFVNNHDIQTPILKADTLTRKPKGINSFSIEIKDKAGVAVQGNFSVAVTDKQAFEEDEISENIFSSLLVSPDLQEKVHNPGYYFKNQDDSLANQLDLVMLTNGWRHFLITNSSLSHPVEQSQNIAGKIADYKDQEMLKFSLLILSPDSNKFIGNISPDSSGSFILKNFEHAGLLNVYIESTDKKNRVKKTEVDLLGTLDDSLRQTKATPFTIPTQHNFSDYYISIEKKEANSLLNSKGIVLKTVNIKGIKDSETEKLLKEHVSPKYNSDRQFTLDLINNATLNIGLVDYIRGKFPGLLITGDGNNPIFLYRGGNSLKAPPSSPASAFNAEMGSDNNQFLPYFFLNDVAVRFENIKDLSLTEVALIRFMPPPVWFAPFNGGNAGAVMIYTKIQSDEVKKLIKMSNFNHYIFNGYSITREFSASGSDNVLQSGNVDNKATLFWNHDLNSDINGILQFKFLNSNKSKAFNIILQGMDDKGRLVYIEQSVH